MQATVFGVLLISGVSLMYGPRLVRVTHAQNTSDIDQGWLQRRVQEVFGTNLAATQNSLNLVPIITCNEPFTLSYSIAFTAPVPSLRFGVLKLEDNGKEAYAYAFKAQPAGGYRVEWNTTFCTNGQHTIQAVLLLPGSLHSRIGNICGPTRMEKVTNIIQIDPGSTEFGTQMWFHGFLQVQTADYRIEIFDSQTNLLKTITGHTDKGVIDEIWDLKTANGQIRKDEEFASKIFIRPICPATHCSIHSNSQWIVVPYP